MSIFIDVEYTYECPMNNYLDGNEVETITRTYTGHPFLYLIVEKETGKIEAVLRDWEAHDGRPIPKGCVEIELDCSKNGLVAEVLSDYHDDFKDEDGYDGIEGELKTISTPEGYEEFTYEYPIHPDELYNDQKSYYDFEKEEVILHKHTNLEIMGDFPGWDRIRKMRNRFLQETDAMALMQHWTEEELAEINNYRQRLRDLPMELSGIDELFVDSCFPKCSLLIDE